MNLQDQPKITMRKIKKLKQVKITIFYTNSQQNLWINLNLYYTTLLLLNA